MVAERLTWEIATHVRNNLVPIGFTYGVTIVLFHLTTQTEHVNNSARERINYLV